MSTEPTLTLRPITRDNWRQCGRLRVRPNQTDFVASNLYSLAQAYAEPECEPLAVYVGATMIGFCMYARDQDDGNYWIYRLMIDGPQQGKGYGRATLQALVDLIAARHHPSKLLISFHPRNRRAEQLYRRFGFVDTKETIEGERVYRLDLRQEEGPAS